MSQARSFEGSCFCGAVRFTVTGDAVGMGFCHCESCRRWSASPVNAFTLWKQEALEVSHGADRIATHHKTPNSGRQWCKSCGGHLFTDHPGMGLVDVYAASIPTYPFSPGVHVHYQESVLRLKDGLPKMRDMPKEMGGSGIMLPE